MKKALPLVLLLAAGTSGCLTMSDTNTIIGYSLNQHGRTPLGDLNLVAGEIGSRHETRRAIRDSEARLTDEIRRQGQGGQEYGGEPPRRYPLSKRVQDTILIEPEYEDKPTKVKLVKCLETLYRDEKGPILKWEYPSNLIIWSYFNEEGDAVYEYSDGRAPVIINR